MLGVGEKIVYKSQKSERSVFRKPSKTKKVPPGAFTEHLGFVHRITKPLIGWLVNRYMHEVYQFMPSTTI